MAESVSLPLRLVRSETTPDGVFGRLVIPNGRVLFTLEDDWKNNAPCESCIPAGTYPLRRTIYQKRQLETFEICDVPNRSRILIHPANTENDVEGCVGVGMRRGWLTVSKDEDTGAANVEKRAVVDSKKAFMTFMDAMGPFDQAELIVEWEAGLP